MRPISASSTFTWTFISRRSWASVNSVGASRLAATVWPGSTSRLMTMPPIGARMAVRSSSVRANSRAAAFSGTAARAFSSSASARLTPISAAATRCR